MRSFTAAFVLLLLAGATHASARADTSGSGVSDAVLGSSQDPIDIQSDRLEAFNKEQRVIFIGNVQARQRDLLMLADRLTAYYDEEGQEIDRLIAEGNVRITQDDKVATSDTARFDNRQRVIVLTGDPHLWQGSNELKGDRITVYIDEDRVLVNQARGVFTPDSMQQKGTP